MKEIKQTVSFIHHSLKKIIYAVLGLGGVIDLIEIVCKIQLQQAGKGSQIIFCLYDNHFVLNTGLILLIGILCASQIFSGYMEIVARRKAYFMGVVGYSAMVSLTGMLINRLIDSVVGFVVIEKLNINGRYFGGVSSLDEVMIYLLVMSWGLFIGAAFYRLKRRTFYSVFGGMSYILLSIMFNESFLGIEMNGLKIELGQIIGHSGLGRAVVMIGLMAGSILILRKAPIKVYAHDWI